MGWLARVTVIDMSVSMFLHVGPADLLQLMTLACKSFVVNNLLNCALNVTFARTNFGKL
jgi:hypothetical protein